MLGQRVQLPGDESSEVVAAIGELPGRLIDDVVDHVEEQPQDLVPTECEALEDGLFGGAEFDVARIELVAPCS